MRSRFHRFTDEARKVLVHAQYEARRLRHELIGPEHLVLALLSQESAVTREIVEALHIDRALFRSELESFLGPGDPDSSGPVGLNDQMYEVLDLALEEALRGDGGSVRVEHLLIAVVRHGNNMAAGILESYGITLSRLRDATERMLTLPAAAAPASAASAQARTKVSSRSPTLDEYAVDLTAQARAGKLDPVFARERELECVIQTLVRRRKNNPLLVGEPGVGKTAIVEKLAQMIVAGDVPGPLVGKRIVSLDLASVVAGTKYRGEFEERLTGIIHELRARNDCILFIDEVHAVLRAGAGEGAMSAASILKPYLSRGQLQMIGTTTPADFRRHLERDAAFERRFQPVRVAAPDGPETMAILRHVRPTYEAFHRVSISNAAIETAVHLADRYIADRFLPDKAIDLIDEAGARARNHASSGSTGPLEVTAEDIAQVVSMWTRIPVTRLGVEESERLLKMEEVLHEQVVGQDEAVKAIARAVRRARAGLKDPRRPMGVFMFLGPTGVGKTYSVKKLAEFLFGSDDAMIRLDMSEFMERHTVARLVGAPPGYVGFDEGGQLTEAVRRRSYSAILLDEIEKAHPDVFNILLQIFDDGHLTDAKGRKVDFRNTIIIMTSNLGSDLIRRDSMMGFATKTGNEQVDAQRAYERMKDKVMEEVKKAFRPEFLNRLDSTVVFHALSKDHIIEIVDLNLKDVRKRLLEKGLVLQVTEAARAYIADKGFDPIFGARSIVRVIEEEVMDPLADLILMAAWPTGGGTPATSTNGPVRIDCENHCLRIAWAGQDPSGHPSETLSTQELAAVAA